MNGSVLINCTNRHHDSTCARISFYKQQSRDISMCDTICNVSNNKHFSANQALVLMSLHHDKNTPCWPRVITQLQCCSNTVWCARLLEKRIISDEQCEYDFTKKEMMIGACVFVKHSNLPDVVLASLSPPFLTLAPES